MPGGDQHGISTGSRMELVRLLDGGDEKLVDDLLGWKYAAVARVLAEAGATHPQVHTPTRIANHLEQHGWQRIDSPQKPKYQVFWSPPSPDEMRWVHPCGIELDAPLRGDLPNYAGVVRVVVYRVIWAARGVLFSTPVAEPAEVAAVTEVLLEIAQQPDEVAW